MDRQRHTSYSLDFFGIQDPKNDTAMSPMGFHLAKYIWDFELKQLATQNTKGHRPKKKPQ